MGLPGVGAAPVERRGTEPANDEPRADPTLPKERPTQVVEPADRVETSPKTQAGDPPATEVRPDPPAIRPEVLRRFTSAAADPVRLRSLTSEVEGARTRLATGGIEVDDRAPILGVGATLTRDRSWRDIAATAFAVQPEAVTAGQYTLLAGRNPDLAALIARGGDPAGAIARQGARVTLDHTIEGAQLRATLLEAQAIALAGSREELARGATTDPVNRQAVAQIDQLLMTSADLIAEARVQAGFARLTTQVGEVERRVAGPQPTTGRVPLAEARRELDALISDTNLAPELQRTLARQSVDLTVLEARTIQPLPPSRSVPASTRAAQAVANIHATIERGRAGIDDLVARGVIRAEDAEPLRHRLAFEGAEVRADHHLRRGDFTQAREAYIDQLQLSSGMPRERLDHALRSNERGMYLFSTPPDRAAAPALIETMRGLPEARRNEMIRSMSRIAAAASTNDEDTAARGALRLLDEYASRTQDPVLWGQNRGIAARNAAMRGDLTTAGTELREALRYAVAIPDPSTRQAFVQEVREQYGNVQLQLAAGAGTYDQRRPAADELRRVRMEAESDSGATPDHRARLLLLEAQALAESSQGARARETLERLRGMRSEVAWAGERVDGFLNRHQSDDAGLRVALRELSSETLGEAMVYQGGGMAAGAAVGAAIGVWLGGIGVVPGAAIGALVGGGLGTAALKGRNYVRANRHGAFDGNVIGGISTAGTGETALNGVSLAFDALAIAAPLKATAMLGRAGARALLTPAMADLGRLTPRLEDDVARAFAAAQGRAQSLPPGAQRAAVEGEMRELILRQWTRNAVSIGGTPVAVAGLAAIAAPVAQQLYEIEASNRSSAEKSRERQRVLSHLGQAGLMVAMFGGTNHLISRYSARPGDVMARLRDGLATDQNHVPLAVGRDSMPQRGHGPVGSRVDIDGPNGRLIIGETESNAPATVTLGDRRFAAMHETSVGGQTILGLRSLDDPASPPHVVRYDRTAGTWESLEVQPGRMSRIHDGSDPRDHVYVARDTDGVPLVVTGNGLARRLDVRVPAGATPDEVAHAHALAHRGLVDTDGDVLRYRVRLNPDDPLVRDMFWNGVPAMGRHETPQGPIWMTEQGMIDTTGRALRHMGESRETNTRFYIDGEGRTLAVGTNAGGQNLPYVRSVGAVEPAMLQGFVPAFSRYSARGYRRTDFNQERARIGGDEPVRLARTLDDIPERSRTEVDVARMPADTDAAVRETLLAARNPGTAYWLDPEGRAYTTVRENGRAIAFNTEGLPVGVLSPDAGGALRMSPLSSVGDPRPILGVGNSIGQYFHVRQGARGPEHFRIVDNGRGAAAALDVEGNAVIIRPGSNEVHPEGAVSGPTGITSYVAGGRHYEVVSSVDRVTSVVRRQLSGGQTEYQVARLEPGSPPRVVIGPPGVTARQRRWRHDHRPRWPQLSRLVAIRDPGAVLGALARCPALTPRRRRCHAPPRR